MKYFILIIIFFTSSDAFNIKNGQESTFNISDQQFSAINIRGRVIPPLDVAFEAELHLQSLPNDSFIGKFSKSIHYGNLNNKGDVELPFLIEMKENSIESIHVSKEWKEKGVRFVYDVMKNVLRDYSTLRSMENSVETLPVNLPLGMCNASVFVTQDPEEKIIDAKSSKSKCALDQDFVTILGDGAEDVLTEDTFNEIKLHLKENEIVKVEVTMNLRGEDASQDFLVAIVSNTVVTYLKSQNESGVPDLGDELRKYSKKEILLF